MVEIIIYCAVSFLVSIALIINKKVDRIIKDIDRIKK